MAEKQDTEAKRPNFEQERKRLCALFAYRLRHPVLDTDSRLDLLKQLEKIVNEMPH